MQTLLTPTDAPVTDLGSAPALQRMDPAAARVFSHLYSRCAPLSLALRGTLHRLQWAFPAHNTAPHEGFRFRLGAQFGCVSLEPLAVAAMLGERRSDALPRELRYMLWADALHTLANLVEAATQQRLEWMPGDEPAGGLVPDPQRAVHFTLTPEVGSGHWRGSLQFDDIAAMQAWLPLWPPADPSAAPRCDALPMPISFVLGHTTLTLREIGRVEPGDIVSIEDWGSSGAGLLLGAQVGGPSGLQLAGRAEGARITLLPVKDSSMNREPAAASAVPDATGHTPLPLDRLDAMEVNLRFEVGDLSLSIGDLRNLRPGHVFELAQPLNRSPVRILAHGNLLGRGLLVAIGDQLGVRVTEFAPGQL